jgi:hypothetical protein
MREDSSFLSKRTDNHINKEPDVQEVIVSSAFAVSANGRIICPEVFLQELLC